MPADVSKRPALPLLALLLLAAACGEPPVGEIDFGSGRQFVPQIADSIDNVGISPALAMNGDGVPFISYLGFPAELAATEIAVPRPIGAPFVPGVLLASQEEGVWNRGAAAMYQDPPESVSVPFGPDTVEALADATPDNTGGTDIAIASDGTMHVVWSGPDGVWYASGTDSFTAQQVVAAPRGNARSALFGWPSVALDDAGAPWVAATVTVADGQEVVAATPDGDAWDVQTVAELAPCVACPDLGRTGIAATPDGPLVIYADPDNGVSAGRFDGSAWATETVEAGADGTGISVTTDRDGNVAASYYAARGSVHLATSDGAAWRTTEAASAGPAAEGGTDAGTDGLGTGVSVTDDGTVFLTYLDPGAGAVMLVSAAEGQAFEPLDTVGTEGGWWPDVAVTPDGGGVSIVWYDPEEEDLAYGAVTEVSDLTVAAPSPPFTVEPGAGGSSDECSEETVAPVTDLNVTALAGAVTSGFEETCLVAPAGEPLTLTFDNQDPGQLHNAHFYVTPPVETVRDLFTSGDPVAGPAVQGPDDVGQQDAGSYYYQCDVHPNMNGVFVVAEAGKQER
jgi:plastocyanin